MGVLRKLGKLIFLILLWFFIESSVHAGDKDVHLQWDKSIDDLYLTSYKIYYNTVSGSYPDSGYATHYSYNGADWSVIAPPFGPYPFTVDAGVTQIYLRFSDETKCYFFVLTAVDERGLESDFCSNEAINECGKMTVGSDFSITPSAPGVNKGTITLGH